MPRPPSPVVVNPEALRVIREKDGHSRHSLGQIAGYSGAYISQLESGARGGNASVIANLAAALNVPKSLLELPRQQASA